MHVYIHICVSSLLTNQKLLLGVSKKMFFSSHLGSYFFPFSYYLSQVT